jgi:hypothetical protein
MYRCPDCYSGSTRAAGQIAGSKKELMVTDAEQLLAGIGWLPSLLRVPAAFGHRAVRHRSSSRGVGDDTDVLYVNPATCWTAPAEPILNEVMAAAEGKSHQFAAALACAKNPDPWLRLYVIMFAPLDSLLNFRS